MTSQRPDGAEHTPPSILEANQKYIFALSRIWSASWAGTLALGGIAGFLINSLTSEGLEPEIRSMLALSLRIDMALFASFLFGFFAAVLIVTSGNLSMAPATRTDKFASWVSLFAAIIATILAIVSFSFAITDVSPLWKKLGGMID